MKRKLNYLLIMSMIIFFVQCTKEDNPITEVSVGTNNVTKDIQNKNGRVIFKDSTVFLNHVNWIIENQGNPEIIESLNKGLGIVSLNSVFQKGMEIEDEAKFEAYRQKYSTAFFTEKSEDEEFIGLPCPTEISYLANEKGIFQVGNIVSKVAGNMG